MSIHPNAPSGSLARAVPSAALPAPDVADPAGRSASRIQPADLERLAELTDDLLCVGDLQGYFLRTNPAFQRVLGWTNDELSARPFLQFVHPDDHAVTRHALGALLSGETVRLEVVRCQRKDGSYAWVSWNACGDLQAGLVYGVARDVTAEQELGERRTRAESRANVAQSILEAIRHVQRLAIADCEPGPVFDYLLEQFLAVGESEFGFIAELSEGDGQRFLKTHAISNIAWDDDTRRFFDQHRAEGLEFHNLDTLFGAVVKSGEPVIANEPGADPRAGGLPAGHPPLPNFLGVPLADGDGLVGVLALSGRATDYDEELVRLLEPLATTAARLLRTYRVRRERTQASEELRRSEQRWRRSIELAAYPVLVWDAQRTISYANKTALDLLQYRRRELVGRRLDDIMWDGDMDHRSALERMRQDGWSHRITHLRSADGEDLPVELKAVDLGDGTYQAMIFDMREWVAVEEKLKRASLRDNLTGLLNRRAIEEHAEVEIQRARRRAASVSLLLVDIDHFKAINDRHGHLSGDAALQRVAEVVSACVRPTDWVGRWGGEEILVVLGDTNEQAAVEVAERVRKTIQGAPLEMSSTGRLAVTVSIGVASGSVGYVPSLRQFFERVDRAMYMAKQQGRNRVVCYQDTTIFRRFPTQEQGLSV